MINYYTKYLKYKKKYLSLINQKGGTYTCIETRDEHLKSKQYFSRAHDSEIKAIAFNTTGTILATNCSYRSTILWKISPDGMVTNFTTLVKPEDSRGTPVVSVAFYTLPGESEYLLVIGFINCVSFWLVSDKTGVIINTPITISTPITNSPHISENFFTSVAVHPTKRIIAISNEDKTVKIWKFSSINSNNMMTDLILTLPQSIRISSVAFHPKLPLLAMCGDGNSGGAGIAKFLQFTYESETFEISNEVIVNNNSIFNKVIFHPIEPYLVISDGTSNLKMLRFNPESPNYEVYWQEQYLNMPLQYSSVAVHPTEAILAIGRFDIKSQSNNVELWKYPNIHIETLKIKKDHEITYLNFHPTLPIIVSGSSDGIISFYRKSI